MQKTNRIISLGYNCEISFRLEDYFGELDSYLFSWSYENDRILFLDALRNIDDVFTSGVELMPDHMFKCSKYNIKFHPRYNILPKMGEVTEMQINAALQELTERLEHLKQKTVKMLGDDDCKTFFVKVQNWGEEKNITYIDSLYNILQNLTNNRFTLVAIFEKRYCSDNIRNMEKDNLKIRTLKKFANVKHTDILGDMTGWYRIIKEFSENGSKEYRKNLAKRRRKIIPSMIINKVKKIIGRK